MPFDKSFCPSPWFHMRITNSGTYQPCRWQTENSNTVSFDDNIRSISPLVYFQKNMSGLRSELLQGNIPNICKNCQVMEHHGKVSGRQRQLLKIGVQEQYFAKSLAGSPLRLDFDYSNSNQGHTKRTVSDWQIDLGNYCNGACIYCSPDYSSKLASEFKRIGLIDSVQPAAWCDDPVLLEKFIDDLIQSSNLHYLHFLGGETVITPGFKKILQALVESGIAKNVSIGFTTNLTVWSDSVNRLLTEFAQVNLGMSIESMTSINDYVRYPSRLEQTINILNQWVELCKQHNWLMQLRITPTCLTIHDLPTVYEYAWQHNIAVESCNFIDNPAFLRIGVLPSRFRLAAVENLSSWVEAHTTNNTAKIINTRDPNIAHTQIAQDAASYLHYLESVNDESSRLPELIEYLKKLEASRGNSILTYLPQYEDIFRSAGY